jgi:hypothetical protein
MRKRRTTVTSQNPEITGDWLRVHVGHNPYDPCTSQCGPDPVPPPLPPWAREAVFPETGSVVWIGQQGTSQMLTVFPDEIVAGKWLEAGPGSRRVWKVMIGTVREYELPPPEPRRLRPKGETGG